MSIPQHRFTDGSSRRSGRDRNPYLFHRDTVDVLEEAFRELLRLRMSPAASQTSTPPRDPILRMLDEQWRTSFAYDPTMQRVFHGDVDAFCAAMADPERMAVALESRFRELETIHARDDAPGMTDASWDEGNGSRRAWEEAPESETDAPSSFGDDPVYDEAFQWSCRAERWSRELLVRRKERDLDLVRIIASVTLVPAKVAFGFSGSVDNDVPGLETAALGYRLAAMVLSRVLESVGNCLAKGVGEEEFVHELLDDGRELLADIESRLAEIESEIRHRGVEEKR